jgi:DUF917 family protein
MSTQMDDEGRLCSMIMEGSKYARFAAICDKNANILWNSHRNDVDNILTIEETKQALKRSIDAWNERESLSEKIGPGRYAIVGYDKIKRITIPLKNEHMLFVSVQGDKPEYIKDLIKIVDYVNEHPSQN